MHSGLQGQPAQDSTTEAEQHSSEEDVSDEVGNLSLLSLLSLSLTLSVTL